MSVIHGANYGTPTLDLNFAKNKSLIDTVSGRNLVTFSRGSTGTYVDSDGLIKTASADTPRFDHDPVTGVCNGLLMEEQRTNIVKYSQKFDELSADGWVRGDNNLSTPVGGFLSPDNTSTAFLFTEHVSSSAFQTIAGNASNRPSINANQIITASIFLKPGTARYLFLSCGFNADGMGVVVDTQTNAISSTRQQGTCTIISGSPSLVSFPNNWYKLSFSGSFTDTAPRLLVIGFNNSSTLSSYGGSSYIGTGLTGYFWGAQLEVGSFPTSYIPTTGSTVTRSADTASITGTNFSRWYNQSEGTIMGSYINRLLGTQTLIGIDDNTSSNQLNLYNDISTGYFTSVSSGSVVANLTLGTLSSSNINKMCATYKLNDYASLINNGSIFTDTIGSIPSVTQLRIGNSQGGSRLSGTINRLTYYPTRLQNFQLQQLTK